MAQVILENLIKRYGDVQIVHGIDLEIQDGEFLVLVGPSGCGKSTILRMIAGLEEITEGQISIDGKVVNDVEPKERNTAMVFQNYALYPHMNVSDNMSFGLKLNKTPKEEIRKRVDNSAKILHIESLLNRKPSELSGGQRQRVAMGRAIVRNPSVFLFDEPLSNLDAKLRTQMRIEIKALHRRMNSTIIYVTHDQVEAMTLGDRIVILKDGYVEQIGKPMELFQKPVNTFVAGFIGSPPMNLIDGTLNQNRNGKQICLKDGPSLPIPEQFISDLHSVQNVVAGIRTEDLIMGETVSQFPSEWQLTASVDEIEPLGNMTLVHADIQGIKATAQCEGRFQINTGDTVQVAVNLNHLHLFDKNTSRVIN